MSDTLGYHEGGAGRGGAGRIMGFTLYRTLVLLAVAILVALGARRLRLPYTAGLVVAGFGLAFTHVGAGAALTHDFIFEVLLPPLLFEAALNLRWRPLRRDAVPVLTLAVLGVVIAALAVAGGMRGVLGWPLTSALVFGVLIAATDPVSVIALFKDTGVSGRLRLLVESESLLNDGAAALLFGLTLAWAQAGGAGVVTAGGVGRALAVTVGGGVLAGLACAGAALLVAGRTEDHLVEASLTVLVAYGSFLLAERLHASGVLATVAAGLLLGNVGLMQRAAEDNTLSERGRAFVLDLWEFLTFLANSLIFLLIGLRVAAIPFAALGARALGVAVALVVAGRAAAVYPLCLLFRRSRWAVPLREQHVLWWGGLRGALGLALALSLPRDLALRDEIVIATFGVVAFSVLVQGLTMPALLRRLRLLPDDSGKGDGGEGDRRTPADAPGRRDAAPTP